MTSMELKTTADWTLRQRLLAVPGVAEVISIGGETKQFQVVLKPARLAAYGIAVDEVIEALARSNENISAGFYAEGGQEFLIHGLGRVAVPGGHRRHPGGHARRRAGAGQAHRRGAHRAGP